MIKNVQIQNIVIADQQDQQDSIILPLGDWDNILKPLWRKSEGFLRLWYAMEIIMWNIGQ